MQAFMRLFLRSAICALAALPLAGCIGHGAMQKTDAPIFPDKGVATVVFMRSSWVGNSLSASVFDVTTSKTQFIGLLDNGTKISYTVKPGPHTFMVIGAAADFMQANVGAGKTYYALVTPHPGLFKVRFSFRPLRAADYADPEFAKWYMGQTVVMSDKARKWAANTSPDIEQKRAEFWPQWQQKSADQRASQTLNPGDGQSQ